MADSSVLDWVKFIANIADSRRKGSFVNVPNTPQQNDLYNFAKKRVDALPDTNAALYPLAITNAYAAPKFDIEAARAGKTAYTAPNRMDTSELLKIIQNRPPATTDAPETPSTTTTPSGTGAPNGNSGDPFVHPTTPPGGDAQSMTWDDLKGYASKFANGTNVLNAILSASPFAAIGTVVKLFQAWASKNGTQQLPQSTKKYPQDILTPAGTTPQQQNNKTWEPPWNRDLWGDNSTAASSISSILGGQMGGGGYGRRKAF